jgi:signal transduction histidine kinase
MRRQFHIGIFKVLKKNIGCHNNLNIRILFPSSLYTPFSPQSNQSLKEKSYQELEYELNEIRLYKNNVSIRSTEPSISIKSTIVIVDRKESLVIEVKNDLKERFSESMGFGTYSNSAATVASYVSIFESFWSYSDVVEKLKRSEELQKGFVQVAAHELRTPIQPIIGLASFLMENKPKDENEFQNIIKIIDRNAKKLIQLTNDILDVTKIETNNLILNEELFNLMDMIHDIIQDYNDQIDNENVKLNYKFLYYKPQQTCSIRKEEFVLKDNNDNINITNSKPNISIFADKTRISQVISNMLSNSIKFTNKGTIEIIIEKKDEDDKKKVLINIKDTGHGIDPSIISKLFSKFTTKSNGGIGLGLFISKNIIEAHGGQIYAYNNKDGKGATFGFSLPLV